LITRVSKANEVVNARNDHVSVVEVIAINVGVHAIVVADSCSSVDGVVGKENGLGNTVTIRQGESSVSSVLVIVVSLQTKRKGVGEEAHLARPNRRGRGSAKAQGDEA
jgi:hypothetical protein